ASAWWPKGWKPRPRPASCAKTVSGMPRAGSLPVLWKPASSRLSLHCLPLVLHQYRPDSFCPDVIAFLVQVQVVIHKDIGHDSAICLQEGSGNINVVDQRIAGSQFAVS